jgi:F-type H+-transporting ATPase subunit delta
VTGSLGRRYAKAVIDLARERGALASVGEELSRAAATFAQDDLKSLVLNPGIVAAARRNIVAQIVERLELSPIVGDLIRLLAARDRLAVLPDVARAYERFVDRELGRARVTVRSATQLEPEQVTALEGLAKKLTGASLIVMSTEVEPELIGGVTLAVGGTVYDGSVKTQLERLADKMVRAGA